MKYFIKRMIALGLLLISGNLRCQQISLPVPEQMPSIPAPYLMRDWKQVARQYDSLVYDTSAAGIYLPVIRLGTSGVNLSSVRPIYLDSYIGTQYHGNQSEAINVLPSLVGATLAGADKSNQFGVNWVESSRDFFNSKNGQNVYLNNVSARSGNDWWYDVMPNVFFYQLYSLYPLTSGYDMEFRSVADRWLQAIYQMGGSEAPWKVPNMNYRAWDLLTGQPRMSGVIEPETAGSLAWLMYNAWSITGNKHYLAGAQMSMDFLDKLTSNPAYEIQLPYGALTAARMNAELGCSYQVEKIINWVFDRGLLRGWGTITGQWDGKDVSGLVGEANGNGNDYAFVMNGFQQAAALVPAVKYDKRFARSIGRWVLNLANASRYFYSAFLPESHQDSYDWSNNYDTLSTIAYEALKQSWNSIQLYARGDAIQGGWASTNLALYGSSHVGYLGAIIHFTDTEGILALDLNKTDFFGNTRFSNFLLYNPYAEEKTVTFSIDSLQYDVYDALEESVIDTGVTRTLQITVMPDKARLLVLVPHGSELTEKQHRLYADSIIVDYHYNDNFEGLLRIKSLAAVHSEISVGEADSIYCTIENAGDPVNFQWFVNGNIVAGNSDEMLVWSPDLTGDYKISCVVTSGGAMVSDSISIHVSKSSGVKDEYIQKVTVYPNPAKDEVYIQTDRTGIPRINAFDIMGRPVPVKPAYAGKNIWRISLPDDFHGLLYLRCSFIKEYIATTILVE